MTRFQVSASSAGPIVTSECSQEPIHIPGGIQPHGALLVIDPVDLCVVQASANLRQVFGLAASAALGLRAPALFGTTGWSMIEVTLEATIPAYASPALRLPVRGPSAAGPSVVVRVMASACRRITIELEPAEALPEAGAAAAGSLIPTTQSMLDGLQGARTFVELCQAAASELRALTGHERVMVYRFDEDGTGEVVAEDLVPGQARFLGLRYPATDIPEQARRLYLLQRVRVIPDAAYTPVPMLAHPERGGAPVDMSQCGLRSVSPVHCEYLGNMGVRSSLVVSLIGRTGRLWGLLVCHGTTPRAVRPEHRSIADLTGQVVSILLGSVGDAERLQEQLARQRHVGAVAAALSDPTRPILEALAGVEADLLACAQASGVRIRVGGEALALGAMPPDTVLDAIATALTTTEEGAAATSEWLGGAVPEAASHAATAAGALVVALPLSADDTIVWVRPEVAKTVIWGGNPHLAPERNPQTGRLSPRASFEAWREQSRGRSAPWTEADRIAAAEVRRLLGEAFIRRAEAELARLRDRDPLTSLPNRRILQERLDALAPRGRVANAALIYIDMDRFKAVNDTLGHAAGDVLLTVVARRLETAVQDRHLVSRIGGDEFAVLCEGATLEQAQAAAEQIRATIGRPVELGGRLYRATASVGVAHTDMTGPNGQALLQAADVAMYAAKSEGGNRSAIYAAELHAASSRRFLLEQDLRAALDHRQTSLSLVYQPVVSLVSGELAGFEALARWTHPEQGPIPPGAFIPVAEAAGLAIALGDWVLSTALDAAADWHRRDRPALRGGAAASAPMPYVAINVSARQLSAGGFADRVFQALAERGLTARALRIEVTEADIANEAARAELAALRRAGLGVMIDDFGTGYSSLSYLRSLPADAVKLDRSFLPGVSPPPAGQEAGSDEAFMAAIVAVAKHAGLEVIAEGVETDAQLAATARAGVGAVQGFLLARPAGAARALELLAKRDAGEAQAWMAAVTLAGAGGGPAAPDPPEDIPFRHLLDLACDALFVTDARGAAIQYANKPLLALCGRTLPDLLGQETAMEHGPGTDAGAAAEFRRLALAGQAAEARLLLYSAAGGALWSDLGVLPIRRGDGTITYLAWVVRPAPSDGTQFARPLLGAVVDFADLIRRGQRP